MSPTLTQVQRLEEEANALRLERDYANEEVGRGQADLLHLDEQLATAKEQLEAKSGTIEQLVREHKKVESELRAVNERAKAQQHKYEVLMQESAAMSRDFLGSMQARA